MSEFVFFTTIGLILGTILVVFGMKYLSALRAAQSRALTEQAYAALAEKSATLQAETTRSLAAIQSELTAIRGSLAGVEKVLKAVE